MKGSRALLKLMEDRGIETMFGYPGGSVIPIYDEILESSIRHVLVRHEQCAAHMADGYSRASGKTGVCLATSGPGATNLITGIGTAYADSVPMLVLTGQVASGSLGLGAFQEVDAFSLMMPVTKHNYRVLDLDQLPTAIGEGWELARSGRPGPVHVDLPVDAMNSDIDQSMLERKPEPREQYTDYSRTQEALALIAQAKRPIIVSGGGVVGSDSSELMVEFAERIGAGVVTPLMGIGSIPSDHPLNLGPLGMHGRMSAYQAIKQTDLVIALGSKLSDRTFSSHTEPVRGCGIIHVDIDRNEFGKHGKPSVDIQGYVGETLRLLLDGLPPKHNRAVWAGEVASFGNRCSCDFGFDDMPILPQRVMREVNAQLDDSTIVTTDVGQNQMWAMHCLKINRPRQFISSGGFGTMGFGLPAAIGAKAARPDCDVIAITGDGGLMMVAQEIATSVAENLPVTICLLNNGWLGMVKQWQKLFWSERYSATDLASVQCTDFVKLAESLGADGTRVERPGEIGDALKRARESGKTHLIEIIVDPEEDVLPMLPPNPSIPLVRGRCPY